MDTKKIEKYKSKQNIFVGNIITFIQKQWFQLCEKQCLSMISNFPYKNCNLVYSVYYQYILLVYSWTRLKSSIKKKT